MAKKKKKKMKLRRISEIVSLIYYFHHRRREPRARVPVTSKPTTLTTRLLTKPYAMSRSFVCILGRRRLEVSS